MTAAVVQQLDATRVQQADGLNAAHMLMFLVVCMLVGYRQQVGAFVWWPFGVALAALGAGARTRRACTKRSSGSALLLFPEGGSNEKPLGVRSRHAVAEPEFPPAFEAARWTQLWTAIEV